MARATARRVARHQAVVTSRAYSRRGAKRKPYTCVFTCIRPRLQHFCAADAQRPPTPPALRARGPRTAAHVLRARGAQAIRSRSQGQLSLCKDLSGACVCLGRPRSSLVSSAASVNAPQTVLRLVSHSRLQTGLERCAFFMSSVTLLQGRGTGNFKKILQKHG